MICKKNIKNSYLSKCEIFMKQGDKTFSSGPILSVFIPRLFAKKSTFASARHDRFDLKQKKLCCKKSKTVY